MRPEETIAAARGAGCTPLEVLDENGVPRVELACPSGWAAARFLLELAKRDADEPEIRRLAAKLRTLAPTDAMYARAVHAFVARSIRFERETGEIFQAPLVTLRRRAGDCDCQSRLVFALLLAGGARPRLAFLHRGRGPLHVLAQVLLGRNWCWLETTVKGARFGEHPVKAAKRAGIVRDDVRGEMGEAFMGSISVEGGTVYRMRIGVLVPREEASERAIADGLRALGFVDATVWLDREKLPDDFSPPAKEEAAGATWTAWAEALYAAPECRVIDMPIEVPADAREGLVAISVDELAPVTTTGTTKLATVTAPSGVNLRSAPNEHASVLDRLAERTRVVVLEEGLPATPAASKGWSRVRHGSIEGFVTSEFLSEEKMGDVGTSHTSNLSAAFFEKLKAIGRKLDIDPEHILAIMNAESGLNPRAIHPTAPASGLFGLMFKTRAEAEAFRARTPEDQLSAYASFIRPWAQYYARTPREETLYQINFLPATVVPNTPLYRPPGSVIVSRDDDAHGWYRDNPSLDANGDGKITSDDLHEVLERQKRASGAKWDEAVARLHAAPEPEGLGRAAILPFLAFFILLGYKFFIS